MSQATERSCLITFINVLTSFTQLIYSKKNFSIQSILVQHIYILVLDISFVTLISMFFIPSWNIKMICSVLKNPTLSKAYTSCGASLQIIKGLIIPVNWGAFLLPTSSAQCSYLIGLTNWMYARASQYRPSSNQWNEWTIKITSMVILK